MKANTPEKIYVSTDGWLEAYYCENHPPIVEEYVHKDAFIEKACGFIAENMNRDGYTLRTKATFINEFRNYMKEE